MRGRTIWDIKGKKRRRGRKKLRQRGESKKGERGRRRERMKEDKKQSAGQDETDGGDKEGEIEKGKKGRKV